MNAINVYGSDGEPKGISFVISAEDWTDNNFSDLYLNVMAYVR